MPPRRDSRSDRRPLGQAYADREVRSHANEIDYGERPESRYTSRFGNLYQGQAGRGIARLGGYDAGRWGFGDREEGDAAPGRKGRRRRPR